MVSDGRSRHRDVHGVVRVLNHIHIQTVRHIHAVFSKHRLGITHEALLQGVILPAGRKQFSQLITFFSHRVDSFQLIISVQLQFNYMVEEEFEEFG